MSSSAELCPNGQIEGSNLIPLADAAAQLGIEPKRLLGFCMSPLPWMPRSGQTPEGIMVYKDSLDGLLKRLRAADTDTAGQP